MLKRRTPAPAALELLYDLFFVAAVVVLSFGYSHDPTLENLAWIGMVFILIWAVWVATTLVLNLLGRDSAVIRTLVIGQILLLIAAVSAADGVYDHTLLTGPLYSATLLLLAGIHWKAQQLKPELRSFSIIRIWACLAAALVFAFSPWYPDPGYLLLWLLGLILLISPGLQTQSLEGLGLDTKKLAERLGIFTVIMLGESFVKTSLTATESELVGLEIECVLGTIMIVLSIWWLYFANVPAEGEVTGRTAHRFWTIVHLPLHIGIAGIAVGATMAILPNASHTDEANSTWTLVISVGLVFISFAAIEFLANDKDSRRAGTLFLGAAMLSGVFGICSAWQDYVDSQIATLVLAGLMVLVVCCEHFLRQPEEQPKEQQEPEPSLS